MLSFTGPLPDYVSNEDGTFTGWHMQWFGSFTNYKLEKEFVKMYLDPNGGEVDSTVIDFFNTIYTFKCRTIYCCKIRTMPQVYNPIFTRTNQYITTDIK